MRSDKAQRKRDGEKGIERETWREENTCFKAVSNPLICLAIIEATTSCICLSLLSTFQ